MNAWIWLFIAISFEVAGTTCLKLSQGFTKWLPSTLLVGFYGASFYGVSQALRQLEVGVVYAIWSAMGVALITLIGVVLFQESLSWLKLISLSLILVGVVGLYWHQTTA